MEISFTNLGQLSACEATYRVIAMGCRKSGLLLSREQFLAGRFTIEVTCDALIALALNKIDVRLILQKVPSLNGRIAARHLQ